MNDENPYASPLCYGPRHGTLTERLVLISGRTFSVIVMVSGFANLVIAAWWCVQRSFVLYLLHVALGILGSHAGAMLWRSEGKRKESPHHEQ